MEYDIVEVVWVDAEEIGETGWNDLKGQLRDAKKPCTVMNSVGYLVFQNDKHVSLLSTIGKDLASTLEKIPSGFIVEINKLTKVEDKK